MSNAGIDDKPDLTRNLDVIGVRLVAECDYTGSNALYTRMEVNDGLVWLSRAEENPRGALNDIRLRGAGISPRTAVRFADDLIAVLRNHRRKHPIQWSQLPERL